MKTNHIFCCGEHVNEVSLRYNHPPNRVLPTVRDTEEAQLVLRQCFEDDRIALKEFFFAMYLSHRGKVLAISCIGVGTECYVPVSIKEIVSNALLLNAKKVIVAHNHPDGSTSFSTDDLMLTEQLLQGLSFFGLHLIDHFIFTKSTSVSLLDTDPDFFKS